MGNLSIGITGSVIGLGAIVGFALLTRAGLREIEKGDARVGCGCIGFPMIALGVLMVLGSIGLIWAG